MTCDLHTHSSYSFDGRDSLDRLCRAAQERHVAILATTDHCDMTEGPEGYRHYLRGEAARLADIRRLQACPEGPELLYGIELGNPMDLPEATEALLSGRDFDFVLGALHFLPDGSDIYKLEFPDARSVEAMFEDYFSGLLALAEYGGFDALAHLDYPIRVLRGKVPDTSTLAWRDRIEPVLAALVRRDIALEINTRGTYDWQGRVGPEDWVLRRYRELGGRLITIGSDAHTHTRVGEGFAAAAEALRRTGFHSYTVFRSRKPVQIGL